MLTTLHLYGHPGWNKLFIHLQSMHHLWPFLHKGESGYSDLTLELLQFVPHRAAFKHPLASAGDPKCSPMHADRDLSVWSFYMYVARPALATCEIPSSNQIQSMGLPAPTWVNQIKVVLTGKAADCLPFFNKEVCWSQKTVLFQRAFGTECS